MKALKRLISDSVNRAVVWHRDRKHVRAHYRRLHRADGGVAVYYGWPAMPGLDEVAHGGMVKMQHMQSMFPNARPEACSTVYLVSSAPPPAAETLVRMARDRGIRVVLNQNGVAYPAWCPGDYEVINAPMRRMLEAADHVFYQSEFCRVSADRYLAPRTGNSEILHNPVDVALYTPADRAPSDRPILLLGGNQYAAYRLKLALQTLRHVLDLGVNARLMVAGRLNWTKEHEARREANHWVQQWSLGDHVEWLGPYVQQDAPKIYRRADLLLHTKSNDPCPGIVLEAMACGLPVVYPASGGVPELVGPDAGIGVQDDSTWEQDAPADPHKLACAVKQVLGDRKRYSEAARDRVVSMFSMELWLERHRQIFEAA